jgi:alpha-ribazole phosphatase
LEFADVALILLRHTEVAWPPGRCYGQTDVPLREPVQTPFAAVRQRLAAWLADMARLGQPLPPLQRIVSSPLQRAARLADCLGQALHLPVSTDPCWMELDFGAWEGLPWDRVPRAELDLWADDVDQHAPPGGETRAALRARVGSALEALHAELRSLPATVLVVTHAGPIRMALPAAAQDPMSLTLDFGGLTCLQPGSHPGEWQLLAFNR